MASGVFGQGGDFLGAQGVGEIGLEQGIGPGRAAALMRVGHRLRLVAQARQKGLHSAGEPRTITQGARIVDRDPWTRLGWLWG